MRKIKLIVTAFILSSCVSLTGKMKVSTRPDLKDIEQIELGKTTADDLRNRFGDPSLISSQGGGIGWFYKVEDHQRAAFTLDEKQVVVAILWMPLLGKECTQPACMIEHFKDAHFSKKLEYQKMGKYDSLPYFSYQDPIKGISFDTPLKSDRVMNVSFYAPNHK